MSETYGLNIIVILKFMPMQQDLKMLLSVQTFAFSVKYNTKELHQHITDTLLTKLNNLNFTKIIFISGFMHFGTLYISVIA